MRRETFQRIDGLISQKKLADAKKIVDCIIADMIEEGFDSEDICEYLRGQLDLYPGTPS